MERMIVSLDNFCGEHCVRTFSDVSIHSSGFMSMMSVQWLSEEVRK